MCRWVVYSGEPIPIAKLITQPDNSIIYQSCHRAYTPNLPRNSARNHDINGDGFGLGWYIENEELAPSPRRYRTDRPVWNCPNVHALCDSVKSNIFLAHIRAASPGLPVEVNSCHPFQCGRYMFMHNGGIAGFSALKRPIINLMSDNAFSALRGNSDSEHFFFLFMSKIEDWQAKRMPQELGDMLEETIVEILKLQHDRGVTEPNSMNFALTDGEIVIATRYRSSQNEPAPSLYIYFASEIENELAPTGCAMQASHAEIAETPLLGTVVNSENSDATAKTPLSKKRDELEIPSNYSKIGGASLSTYWRAQEGSNFICCSEPLTASENWQVILNNTMVLWNGKQIQSRSMENLINFKKGDKFGNGVSDPQPIIQFQQEVERIQSMRKSFNGGYSRPGTLRTHQVELESPSSFSHDVFTGFSRAFSEDVDDTVKSKSWASRLHQST